MNHSRKTLNFAAGLLSGMLFSTVALGDDIDIYAAGSDVTTTHGKPNVLFIIDTSYSMTEEAAGTNEFAVYDPDTNYIGSCPPGYVYFGATSDSTGTDSTSPVQSSLGIDCSTSQRIPESRFHCGKAIDEIEASGGTTARTYIQWRIVTTTYQWRGLTSTPGDPALEDADVDCFDDHNSGDHGHRGVNTATKPYAKDNADMTAVEKDSLDGIWTDSPSEAESFSLSQRWYFFSSNYMNWHLNYRVLNRITAVKHALAASDGLLNTLSDVNVGFMRFDAKKADEGGSQGGMIIKEIVPLAGNQAALVEVVKNMIVRGDTPLAETHSEAIRYYMGENWHFGEETYEPDAEGISSALHLSPSVPASRISNGDQYDSPIKFECQTNHIVLLTDGLPSTDKNADDGVDGLPDWSDGTGDDWTPACNGDTEQETPETSCLDDSAAYGFINDLKPGINGKQNVITHTIGFDLPEAAALLDMTATNGGGGYYAVTNSDQFKQAVEEIIAEVIDAQSSFTAPAVSVNAFNRTRHLDDLYFTLFAPSSTPHWDGNLKKFKIAVIGGIARIVGADDQPAVNDQTGFFKDTAVSQWTPSGESPDGGEASLGGASSKLLIDRTIYTDATNPGNLALTDFDVANPAITDTALGVSALSRDDHIKWVRGIDVDDADGDGDATEYRRMRNMGDPLHSRPAVINYGGTAESPDATVYFGTNDGFLHAVDAATGIETFSFVPKSLWQNFKTLRSNSTGTYKVYGIDTAIVPKIKDTNQNGIIESGDGDFVHLYFGTRRGGRYYYGLDVTDRSSPKLLWTIEGGIVDDDFEELGYTFAEPVPGRVLLHGDSTATDVLFLSGGYDTSTQDDETQIITNDTMGRALFVINALTGELVWRAGPGGSGADLELAKMTNAIPAPPRAVDLNGDGNTDRLYVGDMGGRVWRFDVRDVQSAPDNSGLLSGGVIASLGAGHLGTPTMNDHRRFTNSPDVALVSDLELGRYLTIAIGSGEREHPNEKGTINRFYVLKDHNVDNVVDSGDYVTEYGSDGYTHENSGTPVLLDLSSTALDSESTTDVADAKNSKGWFMDMLSADGLPVGEKVLAEAITIRDQLVFTTFTPTTSSSSCDPGVGLGRIYAVSLKYASAIFDNNGDDTIDEDDRSRELNLQGIPPSLTILFPEATGGKVVGLVGTEESPIKLELPPKRTYWYEQTDQ